MARKKRRRAVYINEVDQSRLERGIPPSWEEKSDPEGRGPQEGRPVDDETNDQRLLGEVPPHWSPGA